MTRYVFSRVPGYPHYTGDKRVYADQRRKEFVCFVIDLDTMRGAGFKADSLEPVRHAADHFTEHYQFPDGTKV